MRAPTSRRLALAIAVAALSASLPALAQKADGKKRVIRMDEITVEGRIQKPQAFYILPRSSLNYESLDRKESFLPKITRTFEQDPF